MHPTAVIGRTSVPSTSETTLAFPAHGSCRKRDASDSDPSPSSHHSGAVRLCIHHPYASRADDEVVDVGPATGDGEGRAESTQRDLGSRSNEYTAVASSPSAPLAQRAGSKARPNRGTGGAGTGAEGQQRPWWAGQRCRPPTACAAHAQTAAAETTASTTTSTNRRRRARRSRFQAASADRPGGLRCPSRARSTGRDRPHGAAPAAPALTGRTALTGGTARTGSTALTGGIGAQRPHRAGGSRVATGGPTGPGGRPDLTPGKPAARPG